MSANNEPLNFTWLESKGFYHYGEEFRHPKLPNLALIFREVHEELGQLVDFYMYPDPQAERKVPVYSAYYLSVADFLSENEIE